MTALRSFDPDIAQLVQAEEAYQKDTIRLIASENYVSKAVLEAVAAELNGEPRRIELTRTGMLPL